MQQSSDIYIKGDTTDHQEMAEMTEEHGSEEGGTAAEYYHHDGTEEGFMEGEQGYGVGEGEGDGGYAGNDGMQDDEEMCHGIFSTKDSDAITMVISPDLPYHLLDPSQEDIDDMEEEIEEEEEASTFQAGDGKVFTDSINEMCLCVCKVCNTKMKFNSLREHVRIQHNLRMTQYKHQYGKIAYSRMTYHRCKICGKVLRAIYATIKKHLQTCHALSFKEYATQYDVFKGRFDKKEELGSEEKEFCDDPSMMCTTVCKVCNASLEPYNMKNHIKGKHFLSMLQYKSNFGEIEFVREVYHSCKVCEKTVLFEYQKLSNHLFFNHAIGIAKYKDFLIGKLSLEDLLADAEATKQSKAQQQQLTKSKTNNDTNTSTEPNPKNPDSGGSSSLDYNARFRKLKPKSSTDNLRRSLPYLNPFSQQQQHHLMRKQQQQQQQQQQQMNPALSLALLQANLQNQLLMQQMASAAAGGLGAEALNTLLLTQSLAMKKESAAASGGGLMNNPALAALMLRSSGMFGSRADAATGNGSRSEQSLL